MSHARCPLLPILKISVLIVSLFATSLFSEPLRAEFKFDQSVQSELATQILMHDLRLEGANPISEIERTANVVDGADEIKIRMAHSGVGEIKLLMRGPSGFATRVDHSLGAILIVSGFDVGSEQVRLFNGSQGNVAVAIEYPGRLIDLQNDPSAAFKVIRQMTGQIALSLKWLSEQPWMNSDRLAVAGISLGGIFLPVSLHIAEHMHVNVAKTIFAYTGSDTTAMLTPQLARVFIPSVVRSILQVTNNLLVMHNPRLHLPYLTGDFLVIRSDLDQTIPAGATEDLFSRLSGHKQLQVLHGPHIATDQKELIETTGLLIDSWLNQKL